MTGSPDNYFQFVSRRRTDCGRQKACAGDVRSALSAANAIAATLSSLRKRADAGDGQAKYEANLQIELLKTARMRISDTGAKVRFDSHENQYRLVEGG